VGNGYKEFDCVFEQQFFQKGYLVACRPQAAECGNGTGYTRGKYRCTPELLLFHDAGRGLSSFRIFSNDVCGLYLPFHSEHTGWLVGIEPCAAWRNNSGSKLLVFAACCWETILNCLTQWMTVNDACFLFAIGCLFLLCTGIDPPRLILVVLSLFCLTECQIRPNQPVILPSKNGLGFHLGSFQPWQPVVLRTHW